MAQVTISDDDLKERIAENGFITVCEPAVGSGAMVMAFAEAMRLRGQDYQRELHVTAVDVDIKCVHMAYLQLSLMHIPAVIVHGNSLTLEEYSHWYTPAHILGGWTHKLATKRRTETAPPMTATTPIQIAAVSPKGQLSLF